MHLLMWKQGGKHTHASCQSDIDFTSDRLTFYDHLHSVTYDVQTNTWYRDGQSFTPTFPLSFTLEDDRLVTANTEGGKVKWRTQ